MSGLFEAYQGTIVLARKISSTPFLLGLIASLVVVLFGVLYAIMNAYYYAFIVISPMLALGILLFGELRRQQKYPNEAIKLSGKILNIYDKHQRKYYEVHLLHVFNIDVRTNPRFPTKNGYLIIRTKERIIETITIENCEQVKNSIISHKYNESI